MMSGAALLLLSVLSLGGLADDGGDAASDPLIEAGDQPLADAELSISQEGAEAPLAGLDASAGTDGLAAGSCVLENCVAVGASSGPSDVDAASDDSAGGATTTLPEQTMQAAGDVPVPVWYTLAAMLVGLAVRFKAWAYLGPRVGTWLVRGAGAFLLLPLFSRIHKDKLLDNTTRAATLDFVEANPGATPQQLRHALGIAWGTAVYHLDRLERGGRLVSQQQGNRHRYYTVGAVPREARAAHAVLQSKAARRVAEAVMKAPGSVQKDLCSLLGIKNPAASKQLKRLREEGLVEVQVQHRCRAYRPTPRLQRLLAA